MHQLLKIPTTRPHEDTHDNRVLNRSVVHQGLRKGRKVSTGFEAKTAKQHTRSHQGLAKTRKLREGDTKKSRRGRRSESYC